MGEEGTSFEELLDELLEVATSDYNTHDHYHDDPDLGNARSRLLEAYRKLEAERDDALTGYGNVLAAMSRRDTTIASLEQRLAAAEQERDELVKQVEELERLQDSNWEEIDRNDVLQVLCRAFDDDPADLMQEWDAWYKPEGWFHAARGLGAFIGNKRRRHLEALSDAALHSTSNTADSGNTQTESGVK